jgi:hypothetical protein
MIIRIRLKKRRVIKLVDLSKLSKKIKTDKEKLKHKSAIVNLSSNDSLSNPNSINSYNKIIHSESTQDILNNQNNILSQNSYDIEFKLNEIVGDSNFLFNKISSIQKRNDIDIDLGKNNLSNINNIFKQVTKNHSKLKIVKQIYTSEIAKFGVNAYDKIYNLITGRNENRDLFFVFQNQQNAIHSLNDCLQEMVVGYQPVIQELKITLDNLVDDDYLIRSKYSEIEDNKDNITNYFNQKHINFIESSKSVNNINDFKSHSESFKNLIELRRKKRKFDFQDRVMSFDKEINKDRINYLFLKEELLETLLYNIYEMTHYVDQYQSKLDDNLKVWSVTKKLSDAICSISQSMEYLNQYHSLMETVFFRSVQNINDLTSKNGYIVGYVNGDESISRLVSDAKNISHQVNYDNE